MSSTTEPRAPPFPARILSVVRSGRVQLDHLDNSQIGIGPYRLTDQKDQRDVARLEAFQDYYRGRPRTDRVELKAYRDQRSSWAALMRGEINAVHEVSPRRADFVEAESSIRTFAFLAPITPFCFQSESRRPEAGRSAAGASATRLTVPSSSQLALHGRGSLQTARSGRSTGPIALPQELRL